MNEIDKNKGYLEIRIGKKYLTDHPTKGAVNEVEHKPGIVNYSFFYGIPILTLKVDRNAKSQVSRIQFVFDHKNDLVNHEKNCDAIIDLLGKPDHINIDKEKRSDKVSYWMGRKINIIVCEKRSEQLVSEMLSLTIEGK
jgi:hypothetical protein